jgi:hypothetical protein
VSAKKKGTEASRLSQELLEKGSKLYLATVDGKRSDDFVIVLSKWADPVRFALDDSEREGLNLVAKTGDLTPQQRGDLIRRVHATMVAGWGGPGFEGIEFTPENLKAWIQANPQHAEAIDARSAADRFFTEASASSSSGSATNDD